MVITHSMQCSSSLHELKNMPIKANTKSIEANFFITVELSFFQNKINRNNNQEESKKESKLLKKVD